MNRLPWKPMVLIGLLTFLLLAGACSGAQTPAGPAAPAPTTPGRGPAASTGAAQAQQQWDRLIAAAQKEGLVIVGMQLGPEVRQAMSEGFKAKYGISIDFVVGRAAENIPKLTAQRQSGLYLMDVYIDGLSSQLQLKEAGLLDPLEPLVVLPEVADPKMWVGGSINFIGKDKYALTFSSSPFKILAANTQTVKPDEVKSYKDLLAPKWKGQLALQDPTVSGAGNLALTVLVWNLELGEDFLDSLARQEPVISRNNRQLIEWVARGKYPLILGPDSSLLNEFAKSGAPLKPIWPVEGTGLSGGFGDLSVINRAPHPAAAQVFINWLLTKEGQTTINKAWGSQSARVDVIPDWIEPEYRIQPGYKYVQTDTEANAELRIKMMEMAKAKLGHLFQ